MSSKVYFTNMRATPELNLLQKLEKLIKSAGIGEIDFKKQFAAIKIHLGEPGNIAYLRPNFSKVVADVIKELGGKPFLTDSNTLYVGRRKDALEHLDAAYENGDNPFCTVCQVIIADGLKGTDEALIPVEGGEYVKEAKIGRAIADADIIIPLSHFKGHELTGFGGAVKNLGMGSGVARRQDGDAQRGKTVYQRRKMYRLRTLRPQLRAEGDLDKSRKSLHRP